MQAVHGVLAGDLRIGEGTTHSEAGIVDQQLQRRRRAQAILHAGQIGIEGQIGRQDFAGGTVAGRQFACQFIESVFATCDQDQVKAARGQGAGEGGANATRSAGDGRQAGCLCHAFHGIRFNGTGLPAGLVAPAVSAAGSLLGTHKTPAARPPALQIKEDRPGGRSHFRYNRSRSLQPCNRAVISSEEWPRASRARWPAAAFWLPGSACVLASSWWACAAPNYCERPWPARIPSASRSPTFIRVAWKTRPGLLPMPGCTWITANCWTTAPSTRYSSRRRSICIANRS